MLLAAITTTVLSALLKANLLATKTRHRRLTTTLRQQLVTMQTNRTVVMMALPLRMKTPTRMQMMMETMTETMTQAGTTVAALMMRVMTLAVAMTSKRVARAGGCYCLLYVAGQRSTVPSFAGDDGCGG